MGILDRLLEQGAHLLGRGASALGKWATRTKGVGERLFTSGATGAYSYGWPGGWSADRGEMVQHYRHWTYVAVNLVCQEIASHQPSVAFVRPRREKPDRRKSADSRLHHLAGWHRYQKTLHAIRPHEEVEPVPADHPLQRLLNRPNEWDVAADLWSELMLFLCLTGNSYLWVVPNKIGKPRELWVIPSHWVWPRIDQKGLRYYDIRPWVGPGTFHFPADEVIHFKFKNPMHKVDGYSPLTAGAEEMDAFESVQRSRYFQFKNGCFPLGALELGEKYADPDDNTLNRIYAKFFARLQGESNYGRPIITPPGAKYRALTIAPVEMAYVESTDQIRDTVLALFGVPKELAGVQQAGSEIAMYGPMQLFNRYTIAPKYRYIGQVLSARLGSRYEGEPRIWWDDTTPDNPNQLNEDIKTDFLCKAITPNEIRTMRGREPFGFAGDDPIGNTPTGDAPLPLNTGRNYQQLGDLLPVPPVPGQPAGGGGGGAGGTPSIDDIRQMGQDFMGALGGGDGAPGASDTPPPGAGTNGQSG